MLRPMFKTFTVPTVTRLALGGGAAGLLSLAALGATSVPVRAASTPTASAPAKVHHARHDQRQDRRQIARVVFEAEADVLGIKPEELRADLKAGKSVSDLAQARGITRDQFADRLATAAKPGLDKLVDSKAITQDQEQKTLARIRAGHIPFWERHDKKAR